MNEKRIARLCWNTNGWIVPSGIQGKSKNKDTHESKFGYGHEEWLFDFGKLINGYHYGFLEPIRKQQDSFAGTTYDIWLYTLDGKSKIRYWVGEIKNVEVLNSKDSLKATELYKKRGWLKEMENQVRLINGKTHPFSNWKGLDLFNIRFKPDNLKFNDPYYEIPSSHPVYSISRYTFAYYISEFYLESDKTGFTFHKPKRKGTVKYNVKSKIYIKGPDPIEITFLHKNICEKLVPHLEKLHGSDNVVAEHKSGNGATKIDIVVNSKYGLLFYEIKTYASLRSSIREAIGQLMEYSIWVNQDKAKKMIVIVQPNPEFPVAKNYFDHIRKTYSLPLYIQSYDWENDILSDL